MEVELQNGNTVRDLTKFTVVSENEEVEINLGEVFAGGYEEAAGDVEGLSQLFEQAQVDLEPWSCVTLYLWQRMGRVQEALDFAQKGVQAYRAVAHHQKNATKLQYAVVLLGLQVSILLGQARKSIVQPLEKKKEDLDVHSATRGEYLDRALKVAVEATSLASEDINAIEAHIVVLMAQEKYDVATHYCNMAANASSKQSIVASLARARIHVHEKNYHTALKEYQTVLRYAPHATPDPRIGIGFCLHQLGYKDRAIKAWERSCAVNPGQASLGAQLYLALVHFNESRNALNLEEARAESYQKAIALLGPIFRGSNNMNATSAILLSQHFLTNNDNIPRATKLAERAVQCATDPAVKAEALYALARALHAQGDYKEAMVNYIMSLRDNDELSVARVAAAHLLVLNSGDVNNAQVSLERVLKKQPDFIEALVALASIHFHVAVNTKSSTEATERRSQAMKAYDQVLRMLSAQGSTSGQYRSMINRIRRAANDPDLFVEVGRLWALSDPNKALKAYQSSIGVRSDLGIAVPSELHNNVGCLLFHKKQADAALDSFQLAAQAATTMENEEEKDGVLTATAYNMAVVQESLGELETAETTLRRILLRHPEWADAKARLAMMCIARKDVDQAHELLKEALTSRGKDLELRSLYTYFLIKIGNLTTARDFAHATTKIDKSTSADLFASCAIAYILYYQARESKPQSPEESKKRNAKFIQSVEYYDRALRHDPLCAFAAQGLAIALAEGAMGPFGSNMTEAIRLKNIRDALNILNKVRETVSDGSVYVNIGHCHAARDEWDRAVEAYETASKRFYEGKNIACLIYLSRAWFQKATKNQSFDAVRSALQASRKALELNPTDDTIRYNIAMIGHKALEVISELSPGKRTCAQVEEAITYAEEAQSIFEQLGNANSGQPTPYDVNMASQRARFGSTLVNRARAETLEAQKEHESTEQGKVDAARQKREEERRQKQAAEERRMAEIRERNEKIAEERKHWQLASQEWYQGVANLPDDDGKSRKKGKGGRKARDGDGFVVGDGDVAAASDGDEEEAVGPGDRVPTTRARPKRKQKAGSKKGKPEEEGDGAAPPKRSRAVVQGSDDEEGPTASKRQKKGASKANVLSAEFVDSDEE